jgi:hypothetical protein
MIQIFQKIVRPKSIFSDWYHLFNVISYWMARIENTKQRLLLFVTTEAHGFENPGGRVVQIFAKIMGGSRLSGKIDRGGPPILGFITFLLPSLLKFDWGGGGGGYYCMFSLPTPSPSPSLPP